MRDKNSRIRTFWCSVLFYAPGLGYLDEFPLRCFQTELKTVSCLHQKVQELREEITLEHQKHIQDIQEAARQDAEMKMTEMQVRHDHEVQQLRSHHERKLEQALTHQQQELEKQHKTELNSLRVQHQQEIDRLRSEELGVLLVTCGVFVLCVLIVLCSCHFICFFSHDKYCIGWAAS